jgi:hypothetical protein
VLRLPDVGRGYVMGDDSGCGGLGTENASPNVAHVAVTYYPVYACSMEFERLWRARRGTRTGGALFVSSTAFVFGTDEGVRAGYGVGGELLAYTHGLQPKDLAARSDRPPLGDEASVFFIADSFALGRSGLPGVAVVWRQGRVLGMVYVVGLREPRARQVAFALAHTQQMRTAKPTPLPPRANDDRGVMLDDPRLRIPVYWLGLSFHPGRRLPRVELLTIFFSPEDERDGLGLTASLVYESRRNGVTLDLWKPGRWARIRQTKRGRGFWDKPCARKRVVQLARGHAELFRSCAKRHPAYVAFVFVPGVVVNVGTYCLRCERGGGAYGSFKGLTAVVRGLRLRRR